MQEWWIPIIAVICWGLIALAWIIGAIYNVLKAPKTRKRVSSTAIVLIGAIILALVVWLLPRNIIFHALWLRILGAIILLVATAFTLWARWILGTMWSSSVQAKEGHQLRTSGPYSITRHPIYTGLLAMILGTVLLSGLGVAIVYFLGAILLLKIKLDREEKLMKETFGEQYEHYKQRVPQLVPGLQLLKGGQS